MLTTEQLEEIKLKIETDKVLPMFAIRELHPEGDRQAIREQLFEAFDVNELRSHHRNAQPTPPEPVELTKEEKIAQVEQNLARVEARKARLQQEKADLENS